MTAPGERLLVCYVPGLDRRRIDREATPFVAAAFDRYPSCDVLTYPTTELVPTLVTGTMPQDHGVWQVSLRDDVEESWRSRLLALVPDPLAVLAQCARQWIDPGFDLAAIPWRRRRHFRLHRFKYTRRQAGTLDLGPQAPASIFDVVGARSRYRFSLRFEDATGLLADLPDDRFDLDFLEFYAFDLTSHWNLDRADVMRAASRQVDDLVRILHGRCLERGVRLLLLVDHGQEPIVRHLDLVGVLRDSGADPREYHRFVEIGLARLWFETPRAREAIVSSLEATPGIRTYDLDGMRQFGIDFPDSRFGEIYVVADHGTAFFPHDFYQPLANLYLGWTHPVLRPRIRDPRHRANHGQHPEHPSERGYMVLFDDDAQARRSEVGVLDVAPTLLDLVGRPRPATMRGGPAFSRRLDTPDRT